MIVMGGKQCFFMHLMFKFINLLLFYFFTITGRITFCSITVFAIYVPYLTLIAAGAAAGA